LRAVSKNGSQKDRASNPIEVLERRILKERAPSGKCRAEKQCHDLGAEYYPPVDIWHGDKENSADIFSGARRNLGVSLAGSLEK
jgi:hypothetical protein